MRTDIYREAAARQRVNSSEKQGAENSPGLPQQGGATPATPLPDSLARLRLGGEVASPASPVANGNGTLKAVSPAGQGSTPHAYFYNNVRQASHI